MAEATKEAGLTMNGTEEEMWKLMESGKLLAKDVIPAFAKELRKTATDGNALAHALENNLSVAVGRATFNIQKLSNSIFTGGLAASLKLVIDSFNEISPKIEDIAYLFGKVLGGAIMGVTFPVTMLVAGLTDLWTITKIVTGVNDEMGASFLSLGAQILGVFLGVKALIWGLKKVAALAGVIKKVESVVDGKSGGKTGNGGNKGDNANRNKRYPKGKPSSPTNKFSKIKAGVAGLGVGTAIATTVTFGMADTFFTKLSEFTANFWDDAFTNIKDTFNTGNSAVANAAQNNYLNPNPSKLELSIKTTVDESGNLQSYVDSRIESADDDNQERAMNSIGSLY